MARDFFWLNITALASTLDGDPAISEESLNYMEHELRRLDKKERDTMRRHMTTVVAQLSRLEVRMMETAGPISAV